MGLLLDTHTFVWFAQDSPRLARTTRDAIEAESYVYLSMASVWEMSIKHGLGRLKLHADGFRDSILRYLELSEARVMPIELEHTYILNRLPHHHRDPFDRMIIAQAIAEDLTLVSNDRKVAEYDCRILW